MMKCTLNNKEIFDLSDSQINVLKHCIPEEQLEDHLKAVILYVVKHKLVECAGKLFEEWKPKLIAEGVKEIPISAYDVLFLIISHYLMCINKGTFLIQNPLIFKIEAKRK